MNAKVESLEKTIVTMKSKRGKLDHHKKSLTHILLIILKEERDKF